MRSYARNQGTQASIASITQDISANDDSNLSENTTLSYIKALKKNFCNRRYECLESKSKK